MTKWNTVFLAAATALVAGCNTTRSISHSDYRAPSAATIVRYSPHPNGSDSAFKYRGELSEFDVLGIDRNAIVSDTEIERTLANAKRVRLHPGDSILLIQSGAIFPDGSMVADLSKHFRVVPFSGVPDWCAKMHGLDKAKNFSKLLRLTAARGGNDMILCYWGILESEDAKLPTKTISWMPVVGWVVPDECEHMRIRLKMALIDVRTGDWVILSPEPIDGAQLSIRPRRNETDQKLVKELKQQACEAGVRELLRLYVVTGKAS